VLRLQEMVEANNRPEPPKPNGQLIAQLTTMAATDPNGFLATVNPELYRGVLPDSEVMELHNTRTRLQQRKGPQPSEILTMINLVLPTTGLVTGPRGARRDKQEAEVKSRVLRGVQDRLRRTHGKEDPTQDDILRAVRAEVTQVTPMEGGKPITLSEARERGVEFRSTIPAAAVPAIDRNLRALGLPVNNQNRFTIYVENKAEFDALAGR